MDACVLAVSSALSSTQIPEITFSEDGEVVMLKEDTPESSGSRSISMNAFPVSLTFSMVGEDIVVTDPTKEEEESLSSASITIVKAGEVKSEFEEKLCMVTMSGQSSFTPDQLVQCFEATRQHCHEMKREILGKNLKTKD
jgi:exosome complex RNA-binding protein Rrp42 (RNase PH superfamily)